MRTLTLVLTGFFLLLCMTGAYTYQHFFLGSRSTFSPSSKALYIVKDQFYRGTSKEEGAQPQHALSSPFWIHGVNYYPQDQPWSLFWSNYAPAIVSQDLKLLRSLGFNTVRIFLPYDSFKDDRYQEALIHFLAEAETQHLKCILTLFDFYQDYSHPEIAERYLERLIPRINKSPALLAWDLKNELDRDEASVPLPVLQRWLDRLLSRLKALDPEHWVTVGWSQPEAMLHFRTDVDYDTFHYYGRPEAFQQRLDQLKQSREREGIQRPLVMGEFGYHTWPSDPKDPHFLEHQYNYVTAMMAGRLEQSLAGALFWNLYDYPEQLKEAWVLQSPSFQYHMGLIDAKGKPKPGLEALQQTVFVRDAQSLGEVTLNTRRLEAVFYSQEIGPATLEWEPLDSRANERPTPPDQRWILKKGLNRLRWDVSATEIKSLIYLHAHYVLLTPPLRNLSGNTEPAQRHLLKLRLR